MQQQIDKLVYTNQSESTHTARHICNSHKPTLKPKIAKEIVCLPTLFGRP